MPLLPPLPVSTLEDIGYQVGTPYQLYDEQAIRENARSLISTFKTEFPSFQEFYAVKALPNPAILKILIEEGCGLDCSSAAELHIAELLGVPGDKVMFTSNYTSKKDLAIAFDQGVIINLDDISLIDSIVEIRHRCPNLICFRLNPDLGRTDSETASNVLGGPDAKFGVPLSQIVECYKRARAAGSTRFGIHMMTGSCVMKNEYWAETVSVLLETVGRIYRELGITFEFINIGGGLGIPYRPNQAPVDVATLVPMLRGVVAAGIKAQALPFEPKLYMENGRYLTGPFGWLVSRCEAIKSIPAATYYGLDACMANLMRPGMYNSYHHITVPAREGGERHAANVVGTLCENNDWFAKDRDLPRAQVGDLFVIHDTGAHSHSMGFQYNGKLRAPEVLLRSNGSYAVIRDREDIHCLYNNVHMPSDLDASLPAPFPYVGRTSGTLASGGLASNTCAMKQSGEAISTTAARRVLTLAHTPTPTSQLAALSLALAAVSLGALAGAVAYARLRR